MSAPTIHDVMEAYAKDAVSDARKRGTVLDYSEASLAQVDGIFETITANGVLTPKSSAEEEGLWMLSMIYGGYVGQVVIKEMGGEWQLQDLPDGGSYPVSEVHPPVAEVSCPRPLISRFAYIPCEPAPSARRNADAIQGCRIASGDLYAVSGFAKTVKRSHSSFVYLPADFNSFGSVAKRPKLIPQSRSFRAVRLDVAKPKSKVALVAGNFVVAILVLDLQTVTAKFDHLGQQFGKT